MIDIKEEIEKISGKKLDVDDDLFECSILDSLGMIQLLSFLEDLGIEIPITRIDRNIFRTIRTIQKYIDELEGEK